MQAGCSHDKQPAWLWYKLPFSKKFHRILLKIRSQLSIQFWMMGAQRMRLLEERLN
jgi:hypothetical protein